MGRRKRIFNRDTDRLIKKIDPSGFLSCILCGVVTIILGLVFLGIDTSMLGASITLIVIGILLISFAVIKLIVDNKRKNNKNEDESDYIEF